MLMPELLDHSLELDVSSLESILSYIGTLLEIISDIAHGFPPFWGLQRPCWDWSSRQRPFIQPRDHAATVIANTTDRYFCSQGRDQFDAMGVGFRRCLREFQNAKPTIADTRSRCSAGTCVGPLASPRHDLSFRFLAAVRFEHSHSPRE